MVAIGTAVSELCADKTICSTCFIDTGLTVTLPCITGGKFIAVATLSITNIGGHQTRLRWVEGAVNHTTMTFEHATVQFQPVTMTLTGCADGDTLKIQANSETCCNSTIFGSNAYQRSHFHVLATDGAECITLSTQVKSQTSLASTTSCCYQTIPGATFTLACRAGGKAIMGASSLNNRNTTGGAQMSTQWCGSCQGVHSESQGANFATNPGLICIDDLDGGTRILQNRRVSVGVAQHTWACVCPIDQTVRISVFEISP